MTEVMAAFYAFWSQFGVPAYLQDMVPPTAELPYITYTTPQSSLTNVSVIPVFNWHKAQLGGNLDRAEMMDKIAKAIPEEGVMLPVGRGYILLRRNSVDFQLPWQDPEDPNVIGGRTSCEAYFYLTGKE